MLESYSNLLVKIEQNILQITINRPQKLNALNIQTLSELNACLEKYKNDTDVWGLIITGAEAKAFVAGADISEFASFSVEEGKRLASNGHDIFNFIENYPKPVIAAVNGFALGGGCELAMACHLRIASENAKFGQPEVNLGIIPGYGGTQRLIQLIGKTKATELLMTADILSAQEALELGLVNHVTTQSNLITKCKEILDKIFQKSPAAISKIIECVNAYYHKDIDGFAYEIEAFASCCSTQEFKEGTSAFLERRPAEFRKNKQTV